MKKEQLPFWHFFQEIETTLSYERWIDKYKLFLGAITNGFILYDAEWNAFRQFCKMLYLQDHRDEALFDQILDRAILKEKEALVALLKISKPEPPAESKAKKKARKNLNDNVAGKKDEETSALKDKPTASKEDKPEVTETPMERSLFYNPPPVNPDSLSEEELNQRRPINFLHTDEYFPVTRRQMVKGWQFLRHAENSGSTESIDLAATVRQIAKDGLFIEPTYNPGIRNREDTLVIFADFRGSMAPFHELSKRLIESAHTEGGHPRAPVYYFQNNPVGYVYRQSNLTEPVKIKEALLKANRNFTLAIIISDAGAARGSSDPEHVSARTALTGLFLKHLNESCAHTIWLNPMPAHRWEGTAAEHIRKKVLVMAPILEEGSYSFQDTLRTVLKQNKQTINSDT